MTEVTTLVLARNAEATLPLCLPAAVRIGKVIVLNWASADRTVEICGRLGVQCLTNDWKTPDQQLADGMAAVVTRAALVIEGDEFITVPLAKEIESNAAELPAGRYGIERENIIFGRPLKHGVWSNELVIRLYIRNEYGEFPQLVMGRLSERLEHLHPRTFRGWATKLADASSFNVKYLVRRNSPPRPFVSTWQRFRSGALLDGWRGLFVLVYGFVFESRVLRLLREYQNTVGN